MQLIKNIKAGKVNKNLIILIFFLSIFIVIELKSDENLKKNNTELKVLDKISSKNESIKLNNTEEYIYIGT